MSEHNGTYRIRTVVGTDNPDYVGNLNIPLEQDYDTFEIMSLKIKSTDSYRLHNSNHGVIAGRVIANNGFGVPNAKISIFIEADSADETDMAYIYPYSSTSTKNDDNIRYNLLTDSKAGSCHQVVGTFPNKTYLLENDILLEVYDKYYCYTTRTNNSGDYLLIGIPEGAHTLHMDLDLSDCGILSQRPRDFVYKGYTIEQFENANVFKSGTNLDNLSQIFSQDTVVSVNPFWGNADLGETIGITRADFDIPFKFETTCVFMGSVVSDQASNGISKKCVPTNSMGRMDELTTGEGRIEMIRKTPSGDVEEFQIKGTQLIDGNGIWCYQIPMNLDYMRTDEYGRMVPTDDPEKGVATRTRVRFRISMQESEKVANNYHRAKVLVPNNPQNTDTGHEDYDYNFGTYTRDDSYRDLLWNNVYTVKSYIPRFSRSQRWKTERFTGIKNCNIYGQNNPIPYNNIRIKLPLIFTILCVLIKSYIMIVALLNYFKAKTINAISRLLTIKVCKQIKLTVIKEGLCPDLDTWYFAPQKPRVRLKKRPRRKGVDLMAQTLKFLTTQGDIIDDDGEEDDVDEEAKQIAETVKIDTKSIDETNDEKEAICLTQNTEYLISCIEMNLAQEYKVINFDFYNDWINGMIYIPRWMRQIKKKRKYWIFGKKITKIKSCMDDTAIFSKSRKFGQLCALGYGESAVNGKSIISWVKKERKEKNTFHKKKGKKLVKCFGKTNGGIVHEEETLQNQYVYYLKPCEWKGTGNASKRLNMFATDIVLLGSLNDCDIYSTPQAFKYLPTSSYIMPTNLALTNMETDGALYADGTNTVCTTSGIKDGVNKLNEGSVTLQQEIEFYNGKSGSTDRTKMTEGYERLEYNDDGDEESDTIAITEASGIAWNYTGPGQGEIDHDILYYPGGHFLGISCVNSQTNKKSCINLTRICEVGASMSERQENVSSVTPYELEGAKFLYRYDVPTGLISNNEIVDTDVRAMLATMNQHRLLVKSTNPDTGYKYYDFVYRRPKGFSGEMESFVGVETSPYNTEVKTVKEENLSAFGIELGASRPDYDPGEPEATQRHTIESPSLDYYLYRMGFDYDEASYRMQKRRFAKNGGNNTYYLPQYENSFYFYFGLHDGSTALDEFNKQFFAECDFSSIVKTKVGIDVVGNANFCAGAGQLIVQMNGMESPYKIEIIQKKTYEDKVIEILSGWEEDTYVYDSLNFGTYRVEVTDADGKHFYKNVTLKPDIDATVVVHNFNKYATGIKSAFNSWQEGGYVTVSDVTVDGKEIDAIVSVNGSIQEYTPNGKNPLEFYVTTTDPITIMIRGTSCGSYVELGTYHIYDSKDVHLYLGNSSSDISIVGGPNGKDDEDIKEWYNPGWWEKINDGALNNETDEKKWALKHYLFMQTDVKEGGKSFSSNVGTTELRTVIGQPQNRLDGFLPEIHTESDEIENYILSDTDVYWETLNQAGEVATPYGSMSFAGTIVGGEYCGYKHQGNIYILDGEKKVDWEKMTGVIGKDRFTEELEYFKVENGKPVADIDFEGIFFPLFRYPSIYRPFYGDMTFFSYSYAGLVKEDDGNGNYEINTTYSHDNSRLYGYIHNGITYDDKWGIIEICGEQLAEPLSATTLDDVDGIVDSMAKFAETENRPQLVGKEEVDSPWIIDSGVTSFSYSISEGTPEGKEGEACIAQGVADYSFLGNMSYSAIEEINGAIFYPVKNSYTHTVNEVDTDDDEDETDDLNTVGNVSYYIISKSLLPLNDGGKLITSADSAENEDGETTTNLNVVYALARYNEVAEFDNLGATTTVILTKGNGKWNASYTMMTTNGKANSSFTLSVGSEYEDWMSLVNSKSVGVTPVQKIDVDLRDTEKITNLYKYSQELPEDMRRIDIDGKTIYGFNDEEETVIGLGVTESGCFGRVRQMMFYPYIHKGAELKLDGLGPFISITPNVFTMKDNETRTINVSSNVNWRITSGIPTWLTISTMFGTAGSTTITLTIGDGPDSADLTLRFAEDNDSTENPVTTTAVLHKR